MTAAPCGQLARNGMVAEHLHRHGVPDVVGVDRLPEAAQARDAVGGNHETGLARQARGE